MPGGMGEASLARQLVEVAVDPGLRESVYRQLGEYCHQCRNRLNSLKLSLFLAMRQSAEDGRVAWARVESHYLELERMVERLQTICRPMTLSRVSLPIDLLFDDRREEWTRIATAQGGEFEMIPSRARGPASFDVERMGMALDALVGWRAEGLVADRLARLRWGIESGRVQIAWDEPDAPPAGPDAHRDDPTWALPLIVRVAEAHGGEVRISEEEGWRLELGWPASIDPA